MSEDGKTYYDPAHVIAVQDAERAVVEAAGAMYDVLEPPRTENYREFRNASETLVTAVRALRAAREGR